MTVQKNHEGAIYWVGPEVENTAAFSAKTLFVNGVRSISQMIEYATEFGCKHIHLGADDSFQKNKLWNNILPELLDTGLKITLEYPFDAHDFVVETLDTSVWAHNNFIPVVACKIQNIETLSKNLCLKVDDKSFEYSNDGVWTLSITELLDRNRQTLWQDYVDEVKLRDADVKKEKKVETPQIDNIKVAQKETKPIKTKKARAGNASVRKE